MEACQEKLRKMQPEDLSDTRKRGEGREREKESTQKNKDYFLQSCLGFPTKPSYPDGGSEGKQT